MKLILKEIRDSEKKSGVIVEKAQLEKQKILVNANKNSSKVLSDKKEEIKKSREKKLVDFRDKAISLKNEKLKEGRKTVAQLKVKAEKNIGKAIDFVMKKFEETI